MTARVHLDVLTVASPCTEDWAAMRGDDVRRFCRTCDQSVYNLSAMTAADAARLVTEAEGNVCVRFYRRADGTMVTRDCAPDRLRAARRAAGRGLALAGAAVAGLFGVVGALGLTSMHVAGSWVETIASDLEKTLIAHPEPPLMGAPMWDEMMGEPEPFDHAPPPDSPESPDVPSYE